MRRRGGLLILGLGVLLVQGALGSFLPTALCPDLGLLVIVAIGLCLRPIEGLTLTVLLGYSTDLLSGSLLGQHALLRILAFATTRVANGHLNLLRTVPRIVFVASLTMAYGVGVAALIWLCGGRWAIDGAYLRHLVIHSGITALVAPAGIAWVQRVAQHLAPEEDAPARPLRLDPNRRSG